MAASTLASRRRWPSPLAREHLRQVTSAFVYVESVQTSQRIATSAQVFQHRLCDLRLVWKLRKDESSSSCGWMLQVSALGGNTRGIFVYDPRQRRRFKNLQLIN